MQFVEQSHSFCFRIDKDRCQGGFLLFSGFPALLTKHSPAGWTELVECVPAVYQEEIMPSSYNTCSQLFFETETGVPP